MIWIFWALAPIFAGAAAAAICMPHNRGKKQAQTSFVVEYPLRIRVCIGATMAGMAAAAAGAWAMAPDFVQSAVIFYLIYVVIWGLLLSLLAYVCSYHVLIEKQQISVMRLRGKVQQYTAGQIARLDVRKYDVRVYQADDTLMLSMGVMMENLDLFFAWTHAHPGIRITLEGKELPKKAPDPQQKK